MKPALALLAGAMFASASLAQSWPRDSEGWTSLSPGGMNQFYVSYANGADTNDGLTASTPKKNIKEAVDLMTPGSWLYIERGSDFPYSFTENLTPTRSWTLSGLSATVPTVVTTYGASTARPKFTPTSTNNGLQIHGPLRDVAFFGLNFESPQLQGPPYVSFDSYGISLLNLDGVVQQHVLFEDIRVSGFLVGVRFQGASPQGSPIMAPWGYPEDISMRRSLVLDSFTTTSVHAEGLYAEKVHGLLIEECLFDHNGWRESSPFAPETIYRHNIYIQGDVTNVTLRGNIVARGGSHGIQCRPGGDIRYNLLLRNPIGMLIGADPANWGTPPGGVSATVVGNVIVDGADIQAVNQQGQPDPQPRGWSMQFQHLYSGDIHHNICAWNWTPNPTLPFPDRRSYYFNSSGANGMVGINRTNFFENISFDWRAPILFEGVRFGIQGSPMPGLQFHNNYIQEPIQSTEVLKAFNGNGQLPPLPSQNGLVSGDNRVHTVALSSFWCLWPDPTWRDFQTWLNLVQDPSAPFTVQSVQQQLTPGNDTAVPTLPRPPFTPTDSLVQLLDLCRQQSKQNWSARLVASPPASGPGTPITNLVHRYGALFGPFLPPPGFSIPWP